MINIELMDEFSIWIRDNHWKQCVFDNYSPIVDNLAKWYNEDFRNRTYLFSELYQMFLKSKKA